MVGEYVFDEMTPLGFSVRCTRDYWDFIVSRKHPVLYGREREIIRTLSEPDEIRRSRKDPTVLLFYRGAQPRWLCAVARKVDEAGYLITAYPTDAIKLGESLWIRSK